MSPVSVVYSLLLLNNTPIDSVKKCEGPIFI